MVWALTFTCDAFITGVVLFPFCLPMSCYRRSRHASASNAPTDASNEATPALRLMSMQHAQMHK